MADEDALLNLSINTDDIMAQFEKVEKVLKSLGSSKLTGIVSSLDSLSTSLTASTAQAIALGEALNKIGVRNVGSLTNGTGTANLSNQSAYMKSIQALDAQRTKEIAATQAKAEKIVAIEQKQAQQSIAQATAKADALVALENKQIVAAEAKQAKLIAASETAFAKELSLAQAKGIKIAAIEEKQAAAAVLARAKETEAAEKSAAAQVALAAQTSARAQQAIFQGYKDFGASGQSYSEAWSPRQAVSAISPFATGPSYGKEESAKLAQYRSDLRSLRSEIEAAGGAKSYGANALQNNPLFANFDKGSMTTYLKTVSSELDKQGLSLRGRPSAFEKELGYLTKMGISWIALGVVMGSAMEIAKQFNESIKEASEFQVQGVMFGAYQTSRKNAGQSVDNTTQNDILSESIKLAAGYGDSVNDVAQDLDLWYKRTGDLASATYMTSQALEFQVATGTQLEETYRTLTALGSQLSGQKMGMTVGDKSTFDLSRTHELLELVTAAAVSAGAGLHNLGPNSQNSADVLAKAIEKDGAAMKQFGFTIVETIAINQSAIKAFGNTGQAAEEAAEKIGRIMGGLASFSDPSKTKKLMNFGIDVSKFNSDRAFGDQKNVLEQLLGVYDKLTPANQNFLATQTTGARQYESLIAILKTMHDSESIALEMKKNMTLMDSLAVTMQGTQQQSLKRLSGAWEGLQIAMGSITLAPLTSAIQLFTSTVIPMLDNVISHFSLMSGVIAGAMAGAAAGSIIPGIGTGLGALVGAGIGAGAGLATDRERTLAGRYGEAGYEKYKDEIARSQESTFAFVPGYGNLQTGSSGSLSPGAAAQLAHQQRTDVGLAQFNSLLKTGPVMGTGIEKGVIKYISQADQYAQQHHLTQIPEVQHAEQQEVAKHPEEFIKMYMRKASKAEADQLNKLNKTDADKEGPLANTAGAGSNKSLKDYQLVGEAVEALKNHYLDLEEGIKDTNKASDAHITHIEKMARVYGTTQAMVDSLSSAVKKQQQDERVQIRSLTGEQGAFAGIASSSLAKAKSVGMGTEEGKGFFQQYLAAHGEVRRIIDEVDNLNLKIDAGTDKVTAFAEAFKSTTITSFMKDLDKNFSEMNKKFSDAKGAGERTSAAKGLNDTAFSDRVNAIAELNKIYVAGQRDTKDYNDKLATINDTYATQAKTAKAAGASAVKFGEDLKRSFDKEIFSAQAKGMDAMLSMSGGGSASPAKLKALEQQIKLIRDLKDEQEEYTKKLEDAKGNDNLTAEAGQWNQTAQAAIYASIAADQYKEKLDEIKNSAWYKGVESAFGDISKAMSASIVGNITDESRQKANLDTINQTINALEQKKTIENEMYGLTRTHSAMDDANNKVLLLQLDQQITKQKQLDQMAKDKQAHPGLLLSVTQNFTKTMVDSYMKQLQDSFMSGFLKNPQADKTTSALENYVSTTSGPLTDAMKSFADTTTILNSIFGTNQSGNITDGINTLNASPLNNSTGALGSIMNPGASVSYSNADKTGQNIGGTSIMSMLSGGQATGMLSVLGAASGKSAIGTVLTMAGGSLKGANGQPSAIGSDFTTAGNIVNGFSQSQDAGYGATIGAAAGLAFGHSPAAMAIGSSIGSMLGSFVGPHYSTATNPDMYANSGFATAEANATGSSSTSANGNTIENQQLKTGLGGKSEIQYIDAFVKAHPGGSGLTGASLDMWTSANTMTAGGTATGTGYGGVSGAIHNGQQTIMDASGKSIGGNQNWQDLYTSIDNTTQTVEAFQGSLNGANQSLVVLNQYGSGQATMPGSYNTPGIAANNANYTLTPQNNVPSSTTPTVINSTIKIGSTTIAKHIQAVNLRSRQSGYSHIS